MRPWSFLAGNGHFASFPMPHQTSRPPAVIREVFHEYGVPGFWNGCQASLVMVINPTLQYTLYEWLAGIRARLRVQQTGDDMGLLEDAWVGGKHLCPVFDGEVGVPLARWGGSLLGLDMCIDRHAPPGTPPCHCGAEPAALTPIPQHTHPGKASRASAMEVFLLSALAKAGATVVTYPMLTVKTRMMTARRGDADMQYASVGDAVTKIWRAEGAAGYYQGLRPKLVQSVLAAALLFMAKEEITAASRRLLRARLARATN